MGTKRTNRTIEDSLQVPHSAATSDRGNQSNEWISHEARPQAGPKRQMEERIEEELKAREMDRIRDRPREGVREMEEDSREKGRSGQFKGRDETDLRERDRRRDGGRYTNGRTTSFQQHEEYRGKHLGDTYPRTTRPTSERERKTGKRHSIDHSSEKLMERGVGRSREVDLIKNERERERDRARKRDRDTQRYREMERQRENERIRMREDIKRNADRKTGEEDFDSTRRDPGKRDRRGERQAEVSDRRREKDRDRDRPRIRIEQFSTVRTRRTTEGNGDNFSDREERHERWREPGKERHRNAKSEGDTDGEKWREETREEGAVTRRHCSRSETEREKERTRDKLRERERRREVERQREDEIRNKKETTLRTSGREENKQGMIEGDRARDVRVRARVERGPDGERDRLRGMEDSRREKELDGRMIRDHEKGRARTSFAEQEMDMYPECADRPKQKYYDEEMTDRNSQTRRETDKKIQEEARSSREVMPGSDIEGDYRHRGLKDSFEEQERKSTSESDCERKVEEQNTAWELRKDEEREGSEKEEMNRERGKERETTESKKRPHRKMWLEPRSGRESSELLQQDYKERQQAKERYAQRFKEQKTSKVVEEMSTDRNNGGVTILVEDRQRDIDSTTQFMKDVDTENLESSDEKVFDREASSDVHWQTKAETVVDHVEGSDRDEEQGSERYINSETEEGSEEAWQDRRDGFVTVSSGTDNEEVEEDRFDDCTESLGGAERKGTAPTSTSNREEETEAREGKDGKLTVFCVVGQTLPRSGSNQHPQWDHKEQECTQDSPWEMGGAGGHQHETPNRDIEAEGMRTKYGLNLSEEDMPSSHDSKHENIKSEQMTKEVTSSRDLEISGDVIAENDIAPYQTECSATVIKIEDHESAQIKNIDEENQVVEESENVEDSKRFSAAPHVKWAKNVLTEILGSTEDETLIIPESSTPTVEIGDLTSVEMDNRGDAQHYSTVQKLRKNNHERKGHTMSNPELHMNPEDATIDTMEENEILLQIRRHSDGEEGLEQLSDPQSLSSDNETDKEGSSKKQKKQKKKAMWKLLNSSSFRELGNEVWEKTSMIRRSMQRQNEEEEEDDGAGRDRRTRIFTGDDEEPDLSFTWSELDLKTLKSTLCRSKSRNSKYHNFQLYQQYSDVVQTRDLIDQSYSETSSIFGEFQPFAASSSPAHSPTIARRPLPALPSVLHPHSLSHINSPSSGSGSLTVRHDTNQRPISPRLSRSFASSPMLWQDLPEVKGNPDVKKLSQDQRRLQEVRFEVVTSESSYCRSLDIVMEHFVQCKQLNVLLTPQDKKWLFSKLSEVRVISHSFFSQLEERLESDIMHFTVCDIIINHCPRFRSVYVPYLTNQSYQDKTYERLMNENIGFRQIVEKLEHSPKCQRLPLRSFLILPFQRITRLKLLVQNIIKRTAPKTEDETKAIKAMKLLEKIIQDSNDSISQMKNIESLVSLNAKVDFECKTLPLISQSRRLVKKGAVTELRDLMIKEKERTVYIHLFNDYLLLSLPKEDDRYTVIDHAPISELRAEDCRAKLHSLQKNLFLLHIGQKSLLLRAETQADKLRWISALSRPHPRIDFNAAQDIPQMQCIKAFVAQQPDELSLEKADVLLVHQSNDGWVEGTRLSDRLRGWVPESHLETIVSGKARQRNLTDMLKITTATATV